MVLLLCSALGRCCLPTKTRDPVAQDSSRPECEAPHEQVSRRPVNEAQRELCQQPTAVRRAEMAAARYSELCRPSTPSKLLSCPALVVSGSRTGHVSFGGGGDFSASRLFVASMAADPPIAGLWRTSAQQQCAFYVGCSPN